MPIVYVMTNRYHDDVSQWSIGEYPDANNQEDDVAEITAYLGVRTGDVGNTIATAQVVSPRVFSGVEREINGVIETRADSVSGAPEFHRVSNGLSLSRACLCRFASGI